MREREREKCKLLDDILGLPNHHLPKHLIKIIIKINVNYYNKLN